MKKISKISIYSFILYLMLMICCVQNGHLHHTVHQTMFHHSQNTQLDNADNSQSTLTSIQHAQTGNTLFKSVFSLTILSGLVFTFILAFQNLLFPVNVLVAYNKHRQCKRRRRNHFLGSSIGLRSPPAFQ